MRHSAFVTTFLLCVASPAVAAAPDDILGIKLGMTPGQVQKAIQVLGGGWKTEVMRTKDGKMDSIQSRRSVNGKFVEQLIVWFNAQSDKVWYIGCQTAFGDQQRPAVDTLRGGLVSKYGATSAFFPDGPTGIPVDPVMMWAFDPTGKQLPALRSNAYKTRCLEMEGAKLFGEMPLNSPPLYYPGQVDSTCGKVAQAHIQRHFKDTGLAVGLSVWVADHQSRYDELKREAALTAAAAKAEQERTNQAAKGIRPRL